MKANIIALAALASLSLVACTMQKSIVANNDRTLEYMARTGSASGKNLLVEAVRTNDITLAERAFAKGANPDVKDAEGRPLVVAAARKGNASMAKLLIGKKANLQVTDGGVPLLIVAARNCPSIVPALLSGGADANARAPDRVTALIVAAQKGDRGMADSLLAAKADVDAASAEGETPLLIALKGGKAEVAAALLDRGANPRVVDGAKNTALHLASALKMPAIAERLIARGANVNAVNARGETPLHIAVAADSDDLVRSLLKNKASVLITDRKGVPSFYEYCFRQYFEDILLVKDLKTTVQGQGINYQFATRFQGEANAARLQAYADLVSDDNFEDVPGATVQADTFAYEGSLPNIVSNPYAEIRITPSVGRTVRCSGNPSDVIDAYVGSFNAYLLVATSAAGNETRQYFDPNTREDMDWVAACSKRAGQVLDAFYTSMLLKQLTSLVNKIK